MSDHHNDHSPPPAKRFLTRALTRSPTQLSHDVLNCSTSEVAPSPTASSDLQTIDKSLDNSRPANIVRNSILAGSVSGMASTIILYPMDLLRTNMQAASMGGGLAGGPMKVLRATIQHGGIRALYTGIALPLSAQAVYKGTVFSVNNITEQSILDTKRRRDPRAELTSLDRLFSGFLAGSVNAGLFVTPVEYVRNQLIARQSQLAKTNDKIVPGQVGTSWSVIRQALTRDGVHTLWRGMGITIARDGIGVAFFFTAMATSRQFLTNLFDGDKEKPSFAVTVASGGFAGLSYWVTSLPLDTVKVRILCMGHSIMRCHFPDLFSTTLGYDCCCMLDLDPECRFFGGQDITTTNPSQHIRGIGHVRDCHTIESRMAR